MSFRSLADLRRREAYEVRLATLPQEIRIAQYALAKAFKINELVRVVHGGSYEWYGFTLADPQDPALIVDIGLPRNDQNLSQYTRIAPEQIAAYQESLPAHRVINGWIHSHGNLEHRQFSRVDEGNQRTVLDYVTTRLRIPVAKREVRIQDLVLLVKDRYREEELAQGSVSLITDVPVTEARILETVYGSFCYSIVIGDEGWHEQEVHYKERGILSGYTAEHRRKARLVPVDTGAVLTSAEVEALREEVRTKLRPIPSVPRERYEKEAT